MLGNLNYCGKDTKKWVKKCAILYTRLALTFRVFKA